MTSALSGGIPKHRLGAMNAALVAAAAFEDQPLAFAEDAEEEYARLQRLQREDPISLQDALNTSRALVDAAREGDLDEMRSIVANAVDGEFLQGFSLQALAIAVQCVSLDMVRQLVVWGVPVGHEQLSQLLHLVCELTNRDNFSDAWRIIQLLNEGNSGGKIGIDAPRTKDGWTPLCVACARACLPLTFKLLELQADPNVITRANDTPIALAKRTHDDDTEEQQEARTIIVNMLRHYGGQEHWRDALSACHRPRVRPAVSDSDDEAKQVVQERVSNTHTRFAM